MQRVRWWKNGDHPNDMSVPTMVDGVISMTEGAVVRRFRDPSLPGGLIDPGCGQPFDVHGWVDEPPTGTRVCPGDVIVTHPGGMHTVEKYSAMDQALDEALADAEGA